jgi:hypothetical protein
MQATIISPAVFDYLALAQALSIPPKEVATLEQQVRNEFPHDDMLMELHLLRAVKAYANKNHLSVTP